MYIHSNNEIDKKVNVSKTANSINTMGDNSTATTAAGCNSRLITVLVQHANDIVSVTFAHLLQIQHVTRNTLKLMYCDLRQSEI